MKTALSLALSLALIASELPIAARLHAETARPVREPLRLATTLSRQSATEEIEPRRQSGRSDWSRVRQLAPGTMIIVTVKDAWTAPRRFVAADDLALTVSSETGQVERIARNDVAEIKTPPKGRATVGSTVLTVAGAHIVPLAAGQLGGAIEHASNDCDSCLGGLLVGAVVGAVGYALLVRMIRNRPKVVYRAP